MRLSRSLVALALAGATASIAAAGPAAARAGGVPGLQRAKAQALNTLDGQLIGLRFEGFWLNVDRAVPAADKAALQPAATADITALTSLRATLRGETTLAGIQTDLATLGGYHVSDFLLPQVSLVLTADQLKAAAAQAASGEARLQAAIAAARTAGRDVTAANAAYSDLVTQLAAAGSGAQAVHDSAIALVPGGSANGATLSADRAQLAKASGELRAASVDSRSITRSLRSR
jgi:hypothetical protein